MPSVQFNILNQLQTPAFYADVFANRPSAGYPGRVFISTDTFVIYRDNGTTWDQIGGAGAGTVTGSGTATQVAFWNTASTITSNANLYWDNTNIRLGIGINSPGTRLDIHGTDNVLVQLNNTTTANSTISFQNGGTGKWRVGNSYNTAANDFIINDVLNSIDRITVKNTGQTFVGTTTTTTGLLVVNTATSDNHIVAIGANAPSVRIYNAGTGATRLSGIGLATTTNNFIQGSVGGEFCIFNSSTTASPITFGIWNSGTSQTIEVCRISAAQNLLIGITTDAGFKLDVQNGPTRIGGNLTVVGTSNLTGIVNVNAATQTVVGLNTTRFVAQTDAMIGIASAPAASSVLEIRSTTKGLLMPRMTTTQKNAIATPATGLVVYDTTLNKLAVYTGAAWETITSV